MDKDAIIWDLTQRLEDPKGPQFYDATEKEKLAFVEACPLVIQFIPFPSDDLQMMAVSRDPLAIHSILYPCDAAKTLARLSE
jgi:hypothetical protein